MNDRTFAEYELEGWQRNAAAYDDIVVPATSQTIVPLMDSIGDPLRLRVLDLACGSGEVAERLVVRGADVVGIDIAPNMVALARQRVGKWAEARAEFREGDAQELPFEDGQFDAVLCNFGFLHFGDPERALREARRVLKPGGICAYTVWEAPGKGNEFFGLILGTYQKHANMQVGLPPAPPLFAMADSDTYGPMLTRAGLTHICTEELGVAWPLRGRETALEFVLKGAVRTRLLYERQTPETRQRIREVLLTETESYLANGKHVIPCPAVMVVACKTKNDAGCAD